jgi:hypothetical protein
MAQEEKMEKAISAKLMAALVLALALAACGGGDSGPEGGSVVVPKPVTVYAAGQDDSGRATVWSNGNLLGQLDGGGFLSVCASGGTAYAVGQANGRPFYWKSNSSDYYYLGSGQGYATSVCVSGGQMYVAGWDAEGGKIWRDGQTLHRFSADSRPWAIAVSGSSVYAAGHDAGGSCVWLNGDYLKGIDDESSAFYSLAVAGDVIYAAGECYGSPAWIKSLDASVHFLSDGYGVANSMHISGDYIYMAGTDDGDGRVWKGRTRESSMPPLLAFSGAELESVQAVGDDVYSCGQSDGGRVWKNSVPLYNFGIESKVYSIFVVLEQ